MQASGEDGRLFQWHDGPLVLAMKEGGVFLMDEISLADDSVLERLNRYGRVMRFMTDFTDAPLMVCSWFAVFWRRRSPSCWQRKAVETMMTWS